MSANEQGGFKGWISNATVLASIVVATVAVIGYQEYRVSASEVRLKEHIDLRLVPFTERSERLETEDGRQWDEINALKTAIRERG